MVNYYAGGPDNKYNSGAFYGASAVVTIPVIPINLQFYRTSQDSVYTFYWTFQQTDISSTLESFDYQLELDTDPNFGSPNLVSFTSSEVITYQDGNVWKGYTVPVAARIDGIVQTWYARVRVVSGSNIGNWSAVLIWTIPQKWQLQEATALMEYLPDYHVYGKGDLLKPVNERNTNLWQVENMYANQLDKALYEIFLTKTDNFIALCRDEFLYQDFGILFNYPKPSIQTFVEYRETLKQLILGSLNGSTLEPIFGVIQTFTGVFPLIQNIRDLDDFFLNLIQQGTPNSNVGAPYTEPGNGVRTQFHVQYEFLSGTMSLFKNGNLLTSGIDYTEDEALPGFNTTTPPLSTDVLVVFYQIGKSGDPRPVLFDPTATVVLTGNITYTNGSLDVVGIGTSFTTQLVSGDILIDPSTGYYATVFDVESNTTLKLVDVWGGPTETVPVFKTQYNIPPIVLWDKGTLAFGVIITVLNPADFDIDLVLIESLINPLLPANVKVFYELAI